MRGIPVLKQARTSVIWFVYFGFKSRVFVLHLDFSKVYVNPVISWSEMNPCISSNSISICSKIVFVFSFLSSYSTKPTRNCGQHSRFVKKAIVRGFRLGQQNTGFSARSAFPCDFIFAKNVVQIFLVFLFLKQTTKTNEQTNFYFSISPVRSAWTDLERRTSPSTCGQCRP